MSHLLNVCKILAERDCDDEILAAALLHDTVEDTDVTIEEIYAIFGERIATIVKGCTEQDKLEKLAIDKKSSWKERKEHTIHFLITEATTDQLLVAAADKLDNLRSIAYDLQLHGNAVWNRFNASVNEQEWYYRWLTQAFESKAAENNILAVLTTELRTLCDIVFLKT